MNFQELATARYSCKRFSDLPIDPARLQYILECGRLAPTAKNLQEWHIYVATSKEALAKIDTCTPCRYGAPIVLVVVFDKTNVYHYPGGRRDSGIEDASIVATHLTLAATDMQLGSCWVNCFDPDALHASLGLPENEEILMLLDVGIPHGEAGPLPNHASRKPLSETVSYI